MERAEQEEVECEEWTWEEEGESDGAHPVGTLPQPWEHRQQLPTLGSGEFDPNIDVYGIKCHESKWEIPSTFFFAIGFCLFVCFALLIYCVIINPVKSMRSCKTPSQES